VSLNDNDLFTIGKQSFRIELNKVRVCVCGDVAT